MPHALAAPDVRAAYLAALAARPCLRAAARAVGVSSNAASWARERDPELDAAVAALVPRRVRRPAAPNAIGDPAVRAAFLAAYAEVPNIWHACAAAGVSRNAVDWLRYRDPEFAAALGECRRGPARRLPRARVFGAAARADFLAALAVTGHVGRAAVAAGIDESTAHRTRAVDGDFAAGWADAKRIAQERVEDALYDGALNGFVSETVDADGRKLVRRARQPGVMLRLLDRRDRLSPPGVGRWVELTPQINRQAKRKLAIHLRLAGQQAAAEALADRDGHDLEGPRMRPVGAWEAVLNPDGSWNDDFLHHAPEMPDWVAENDPAPPGETPGPVTLPATLMPRLRRLAPAPPTP